MIYTVTFNPSLDYIVTLNHFQEGVVNRTKEEKILAGGKGINVSTVLKNLNHENTALGFVAGFTGNEIIRILEENEITSDFIQVEKGMTRINIKLRAEAESEINGQGPEISHNDIEELFHKLDSLNENDVLVLAGSIPDVMPDSMYRDIMERFQRKKLNIVVDATKDLLMNVLEFKPFLIKPNHHELGEIFGVKLTDKESVVPYAKKLKEIGARNVLVSMAGEGAVLAAENGEIYQSDAPKGTVKNSVGAGDSMVAGFIAGYLQSGDYKEAFKMGVCAGSASAFSENLATKKEIMEISKLHQFNLIR